MNRQAISTPGSPGHLNFMAQGISVNEFTFAVTVPRDPATLEIPDTFEEQARFAFENLTAVLDAAGCSFGDVVKLTIYLSDMDNWERMNVVYKRFVDLSAPPVRCTVEIARLNNDYMIELDAIAAASEV